MDIITVISKTEVAMSWLPIKAVNVTAYYKGKEIVSQWIPDVDYGGVLIVKLPSCGKFKLDLRKVKGSLPEKTLIPPCSFDDGRGALPTLDNVCFNDSLIFRFNKGHLDDKGNCTYKLRNDNNAKVYVLSKGPLAYVVRTFARYCDEKALPMRDGEEAFAIYDWYFLNKKCFVRAKIYGVKNEFIGARFLDIELKDAVSFEGGYPIEQGNIDSGVRGFENYARLYGPSQSIAVLKSNTTVEGNRMMADSNLSQALYPCMYRDIVETSAWLCFNGYSKDTILPTDAHFSIEYKCVSKKFGGERISVFIEKKFDGIKVTQMICGGEDINSIDEEPIFIIQADNKVIRSDEGWHSVDIREESITFKGWNEYHDYEVVISVKSLKDGLETQLSCKVPNIDEVHYPIVSITDSKGLNAFIPSSSGIVEKNILDRCFHYHNAYPAPFSNMSILGAYNPEGKGLCVIWRGNGERRDYSVDSIPIKKALRIYAKLYPEQKGSAQSYKSPPVTMHYVSDGWWDISRHYLSYSKKTPWVKQSKTSSRMEDIDFWLRASIPSDSEDVLDPFGLKGADLPEGETAMQTWTKRILEVKKKLNVSLAVHAYNWHKIPFDNDYPHFFPERKGFKEAIKELQASDIKVMPYINARLWDTHDKGNCDWQFASLAYGSATKNNNNEIFIESYGSKEIDGSKVELAVMCPTTKVWQDKIVYLCERIINELNADGVYLDQIAAAPPMLCMDKKHGHPLGGGDWWWKSYDKLIYRIRQKLGDVLLTTECNAEPFMAQFDGYLTWNQLLPGQVPFFPSIYNKNICTFGRGVQGEPKAPENRAALSQSFLFGEQLGWINPETILLLGEPFITFLRKLIATRAELRSFFNKGCLLKPPKIECDKTAYVWRWDARKVYLKNIMGGLWKYGSDTVLILVNPTDCCQQGTLFTDGRCEKIDMEAMSVKYAFQ